MTVLVLAEDCDTTVDRVVDELNARDVPVFRCDTGWFPQRLVMDARVAGPRWAGTLRAGDREVELLGLRSVWYRRPTAFALPDGMTGPERRHAFMEAKYGLGGVLTSLPVLWCNHPGREADANYKPRQLVTARSGGLEVPASLVTNSADAVRSFARHVGGHLVTKPLGSMYVFEDGRRKVAPTTLFGPGDLADLTGVELTAHLFQEWVDKRYEVRLTVVGERLFPVAIHAGSEAARIDWRTDYPSLRYSVIELPPAVEKGVRAYLAAFGMTFGTFDFAVTPDDRWVFFECNTQGQFGWIEAATGLPISIALADLLEKGT